MNEEKRQVHPKISLQRKHLSGLQASYLTRAHTKRGKLVIEAGRRGFAAGFRDGGNQPSERRFHS